VLTEAGRRLWRRPRHRPAIDQIRDTIQSSGGPTSAGVGWGWFRRELRDLCAAGAADVESYPGISLCIVESYRGI